MYNTICMCEDEWTAPNMTSCMEMHVYMYIIIVVAIHVLIINYGVDCQVSPCALFSLKCLATYSIKNI